MNIHEGPCCENHCLEHNDDNSDVLNHDNFPEYTPQNSKSNNLTKKHQNVKHLHTFLVGILVTFGFTVVNVDEVVLVDLVLQSEKEEAQDCDEWGYLRE